MAPPRYKKCIMYGIKYSESPLSQLPYLEPFQSEGGGSQGIFWGGQSRDIFRGGPVKKITLYVMGVRRGRKDHLRLIFLSKNFKCFLVLIFLVSPGYTSLRPWSLHSSCDNPTETISACISLGDQPSFSNPPYHHLIFIISIFFIPIFIKKTIKDEIAPPYTPY